MFVVFPGYSGRAYYQAYSKLLVDFGYTTSIQILIIYIWVHVDDTFTAATSVELLDEFERIVKSQLKITVKSDVDLYLGIHFYYLPNNDVKRVV